jgi:hypothetical protein
LNAPVRPNGWLAALTPANTIDFLRRAAAGDQLSAVALRSAAQFLAKCAGGDRLCGCCGGPLTATPPAVGVFSSATSTTWRPRSFSTSATSAPKTLPRRRWRRRANTIPTMSDAGSLIR